MKLDKTTILIILILLAGLSLLLYPTVSNIWNSFTSSQAMGSYDIDVAELDEESYDEIWSAAKQFNDKIKERQSDSILPEDMKDDYNNNLNVSQTGVMGYITIPKIDVHLPIYHGTDEAILQIAVGHLEWTSLPVGGVGTHAAFSGHRGLPSAKLFTDLDELEVGDRFTLKILDEILTYEVDQIKVVEPQVIEDLRIVEGQDLVTLVTCTPYGVNSHRLLVRGHRVDNAPEVVERHVTSDAVLLDPLGVAAVLAVPCVVIGVAAMFAADEVIVRSRHKKREKKEQP